MAQLHDVFITRIEDLKTQSDTLGRAERGAEQRVWMLPTNMTAGPLDVPKLHLPSFDRTKINDEYNKIHADKGAKVGEAGSLKIQLDYVATMERAFRMRHATHIRCVGHAAARHNGHGNGAGVFGAVRNFAQDLLNAGGS